MIPYVEIIGKYTLKPFAVVEPSECWFELSYYDIGEFEVYAPATSNNLNALKMGNYVRIPNKPYLWLIKSVDYSFNSEGARMIDVKGFEAKWLLNQRIIREPVNLSTDLATAIYDLVYNNLGAGALSFRRIVGFNVVRPSFSITIDQTQATRGNLWEFVRDLLKANNCGCYTTYENGNINFYAISGVDKSSSIIFSQSMDNLISSDYFENSENYKNCCLVVSTFKENNQNVEYYLWFDTEQTNIDRYEMLVNSNISTKYIDENGVERTTTPSNDPSTLYGGWLLQEGKNQVSQKIILREFNGEIDLQNSMYEFEADFFIGDLVLVRDEYFNYQQPTRITKYTFKQDATGYGEEAEYGNE